MPAVLKIDPQRRVAVSTFYGHVTGKDVLRHQAVIVADPHFHPSFADVVDFSSVSAAAVKDTILKSLAGTRSVFHPDVPHVIIAPADLRYELALKYRDLAQQSRPNLHVVRTLAEARELLERLGYRL
jgi:hypothetical protein